jgi:hypothetical protein
MNGEHKISSFEFDCSTKSVSVKYRITTLDFRVSIKFMYTEDKQSVKLSSNHIKNANSINHYIEIRSLLEDRCKGRKEK